MNQPPHPPTTTEPDARLADLRAGLIEAMELDAMPPADDHTSVVADCTWNTDQLAALVTWALEQGVTHGVHPANIIPDESDWPTVPWQPAPDGPTPTGTSGTSMPRGWYWGRNRGGRLTNAHVAPGPGIDNQPSVRIAPITSKTNAPTWACWIELTIPMATKLVEDLTTEIAASHTDTTPSG